MGCVSQKPKPQPNDSKAGNRQEQSGVKQGSNAYGASAQPENKYVGENKAQAQPSQNSMVKPNKDDPLKVNDPYATREGYNNPYESNARAEGNPAAGSSKVNGSGVAHSGAPNGNYNSGVYNQPGYNGNASAMKGSNPQGSGVNYERMVENEDKFGGSGMQGNSKVVGQSNHYGNNSDIHNSNPYAYNETGGHSKVGNSNMAGNSEGHPNSAIKVSVVPPGQQNNHSNPSSAIKPTGSVLYNSKVHDEKNPDSGNYHQGSKLRETNPYAYGSGADHKEEKNVQSLVRMMGVVDHNVPEEERVPMESRIQTEGCLWSSGLLKLD